MNQISLIFSRFYGLFHYRFLIKQLIIRDVKLKYRRSVLGYLWSLLNPLLMMLVLVVIFSNFFRFDIPNYPMYLITGSTLFSFAGEATSMAIYAITSNAALIKKTYIPKYVFTISRVTSSLINMLFSMAAIVLVALFTGVKLTPLILLFPVVIFEVYCFSLGLSLFLSAASVFFRDLQYLWGIFVTMWNYLTPIFYPVSIIPEQYRFIYCTFNPMVGYVTQFRDIVIYGRMPEPSLVYLGFFFAAASMLIGVYIFKKSQDNFILYI